MFGGHNPVVSTSRLMKHSVLKAEGCAPMQACVNSLGCQLQQPFFEGSAQACCTTPLDSLGLLAYAVAAASLGALLEHLFHRNSCVKLLCTRVEMSLTCQLLICVTPSTLLSFAAGSDMSHQTSNMQPPVSNYNRPLLQAMIGMQIRPEFVP